MSTRLLAPAVLLGVLAAGCAEQPGNTPIPPPQNDQSDASATGSVRGRVTWTGKLPEVPSLIEWKLLAQKGPWRFERRNPNAPAVDPEHHGVGSAIVFLRGVDTRAARPWDLPPVRVEIGAEGIHVRQGETVGQVGFVRRGDSVEMVSTQNELHVVRASGAALFSLPFPDPESPLSRSLDRAGLVELTSGTGHWWMRGYLFVTEHPYHVRTDPSGGFTLPQVPAGRYEIVCWAPNYQIAGHDRDPEACRITRIRFQPSAEKVQAIEVRAGTTSEARFDLSDEDFRR